MNKKSLVLLLLALSATACDGDSTPQPTADTGKDAVIAKDTVGVTGDTVADIGNAAPADVTGPADAAVPDVAAAPDVKADAGAPDTDTYDTVEGPELPPTLAERGYIPAKGSLHVHTAYSHDACDGEGISEQDVLDAPCVERLKAAICKSGLDFVMLTDHPAHMSEYPFEQLLHYDPAAGDELVKDGDGNPIANLLTCTNNGVTRKVPVRVGFEGTHTLPVALGSHLTPASAEKISIIDDTPAELRLQVVDAIHATGGVALIAHSEEEELSAETIESLPLDGMEMYNVHANFTEVLGNASDRIMDLEVYLDPAPGGPDPNLVVLLLLDVFPEPGMVKWRRVAGHAPITGVLGHDVHENVNLSGYCDPGGQFESFCDLLADTYPNLVATLKAGGPVIMQDGERLDSYERVFGWYHNRLLVKDMEVGSEQEALVAGRNYAVWDVFGEPVGIDVVARDGDTWLEVGSSVSLASAPIIWLRLPATPVPKDGATWTADDAFAAKLHATLWRLTDADEPEDVWHTDVWGSDTPFVPTEPGAYQLEVKITPLHLTAALGPMPDIASREFRWVEANPIYVTH